MLLVGGVRLRAVDSPTGVLGWGVERGELQRTVPDVADIVPHSLGHEHRLARAQAALKVEALLARADAGEGLPPLHTDELVRIRMHLQADLTAGRYVHQSQLQMTACPKHRAEIPVAPRRARLIHRKRLRTVIHFTGVTSALPKAISVHI